MKVETNIKNMEFYTNSGDYKNDGKIVFSVFYLYESKSDASEVESEHVNIETSIERMDSNTNSGDYSSSHEGCSIRLICKNARIKEGTCQFT